MSVIQGWIGLAEYAQRNGISLSTLRRRIKRGEIENRFEHGRYFLREGEGGDGSATSSDSDTEPGHQAPRTEAPSLKSPVEFESLFSELKQAYAMVLQEKEVQIRQLREELADLRTLVRVLESENERLLASRIDLG